MFKVNIVAGEKPVDGSGSGGIVVSVLSKAVDVFFWFDEVSEGVGLRFIGDGKLQDNAIDLVVIIGGEDFIVDFVGGIGAEINDFDANVFAVLDFKVNVFSDNWVIAVADDEEGGLMG